MDKFGIDYLKLNPSLAFLVACSIPILIASLRWYHHGRDISIFILAGDEKVDKNLHPFDIKILERSTGYDGQYFYQLALDPFSTDENGYGIKSQYDIRKQRIFYPFVVFIASLGNPEMVPYMMVMINLIAFFVSFYFIQKLLTYYNSSPNHVILWALFTGPYIALSRNLAEAVAICLVIMAMYSWSNRRKTSFIIVMTLALFTRDDTLIVLFPFWSHLLWEEIKGARKKILNFCILILPFISLFAWKYHIISNYGIYRPVQFTNVPLSGLILGISKIWNNAHLETKNYLFLFYVLGFLIWHIWTIKYALNFLTKKAGVFNFLLSISFGIWMILALFFTSEIYSDDAGFGRILSTLSLICFLLIIMNTKKINSLYTYYTFGTFIVVSCKIIILL